MYQSVNKKYWTSLSRALRIPRSKGQKEVSQDGRRRVDGENGAMVEVPRMDGLSSGPIESKVISVEEAAALVGPGSTVMVGGFGLVGSPLTLIEALLSSEDARDLTTISNNVGEPGRGAGPAPA